MKKPASTNDLTAGTTWKVLVWFSIPVLIGQVFQLLYGIVDAKIVGATLGETALAAVGSVSVLYNLLSWVTMGITQGFSILTANFFGAKNEDKVKKSFAMSTLFCLLTTLAMSAAVMIFFHPILHMLKVPTEQYEMAATYIGILTVGLFATALYHTFANSMRAVGNSITPLIYLIVASVGNVVLDYVFIVYGHMGVEGAAYATVLAQLVAAVFCWVSIRRKMPLLTVSWKDFKPDWPMVSEQYKAGMSMALMMSLVVFGSIALQVTINQLGTDVIVAHIAARKLFEMMMLPGTVFGATMSSFAGQNYGAKKVGRIGEALKASLILAIAWSVLSTLMAYTISPNLIGFIASTDNQNVLYWGSMYMRVDMPFMAACVMVSSLRNAMQGFGDRVTPVISSIIELVSKFVFALAIIPILGYWGVIWSEPLIWVVMMLPMVVKMRKVLKSVT